MNHAKAAHQVAVVPDAANLLADLIGGDLGRLDCELAKLAIQAQGGRITPDDIAGSVVFQRDQEMWDMTNALASGSPAEAVRRWRQLLQSDSSSEFRAVTWLTMWLEKTRKALALKRKGMGTTAICQQVQVFPDRLHDPFMKTATALGTRGVTRALNLLAEVDLQSKSGVGEAADNIERFLLSVNLPQ